MEFSRCARTGSAQLEKPAVRGIDIRNSKVEDGTRMIQFRRFGGAQHQAHAAAIKENQVAGSEEQRQTQRVTVECGGAWQVVNDDGDLADILDAEA